MAGIPAANTQPAFVANGRVRSFVPLNRSRTIRKEALQAVDKQLVAAA
jgi:hypothetical protein